jgi:hypothetical protein
VSPTRRLLANALLRLVLLGFGMWFAFSEAALPGAHLVSRAALVMLFVAVALLIGEMGQMREQVLSAARVHEWMPAAASSRGAGAPTHSNTNGKTSTWLAGASRTAAAGTPSPATISGTPADSS